MLSFRWGPFVLRDRKNLSSNKVWLVKRMIRALVNHLDRVFLIYCHCQSSPTYKSTRTKAFLSIKLGKLSSQRLNRSRQMKVSTFHNVQSTDTVMVFLDVLTSHVSRSHPRFGHLRGKSSPHLRAWRPA